MITASSGTITRPGKIKPRKITDSTNLFPPQTSLERRLRNSDSTTNQQRVVVVCPYQQFNTFFEMKLPQITPGVKVECIAHTDLNHPPYINVEEIEKEKPLPFYIIDFQHLISQVPSAEQYIQKAFEFIVAYTGAYSRNKDINKQLQDEWRKRDRSITSPLETILKKLSGLFHDNREELDERLLQIVAQDTTTKPVDDLIKFSGYDEWRRKKRVPYITPQKRFAGQLSALHEYDADGNFNPAKPDIKLFQETLKNDVRILLYPGGGRPHLLKRWSA